VHKPRPIGARHPDLVPRATLDRLEAGDDACANFMEQTALDMGQLFGALFPSLEIPKGLSVCPRLVTRMRIAANALWNAFGPPLFCDAPAWPSDTARGWAAMAVGLVPNADWAGRLSLAARFGSDHHFAVREWAWLGIRDHVVDEPLRAIRNLSGWALAPDPNLRRFASEATRPIGVWSRHVPALKHDPSAGLPLLEALMLDESQYVRTSVGNWLNDASKSNPIWVQTLCQQWRESHGTQVERLCCQATRTITPQG
jgi:3-methyladenine DNA glycosylase AlkC